jgi:23S rRNA pseudouridine1911/1915/1917 synthase
MVFAKTPQKAAEWTRRFQKGAVRKRYVAVTEPTLYPAFGELRHYLQKDSKRHRAKLLYKPTPGAGVAVLRYQVLAEKITEALRRLSWKPGGFIRFGPSLAK